MDGANRSMDRHTKRRLKTRTDLLRAALRLFGTRNPVDVSVQDITALADVGSGSFYNHFDSKQAIYDAVVEELVDGWVVWMRQHEQDDADPALRLSHRLRACLERGRCDPDFARFVARNGLSLMERQSGPEASLSRDIERGLSVGRFTAVDHLMAKRAAIGITLSIQHAFASGRDEPMASTRAAWYVLMLLGVSKAEADRLVALPLPVSDPDDFMLVEYNHLRGAAAA
ncbi:MAG TPA: TetR/AcrR family transcriptional regulator [Alphaproteobacteria bacterium]|nr:TetR/AcrR family transcriptional regulator [Alphaproteobacteria bacterium]